MPDQLLGVGRLTELAKEQWATGAHGDKHLCMSRALFNLLLDQWPKPPPVKPWEPKPLADLDSIPVVIDEGIGDTTRWELRYSRSNWCVEVGHVYPLEATDGTT